MGFAIRVSLLSAALALVAFGSGSLFLVRIEPGQTGVRQNDWSGTIDPLDHRPGLHLRVPGVHSWHVIDRRSQVLRFTEATGGELDRPLLEIRTRDRNTARVDLAVLWRVRPGEAAALVREGLERVHVQRLVASVEDVLRGALAQLSSEDWFSTAARRDRVAAILPELEGQCRAFHVEIQGVLLRAVAFAGEYEEKLQEKQIDYQRDLLVVSKREVDLEQAELTRMRKETEAQVKERKAAWSRERADLVAANELEALTRIEDAKRAAAAVRLAAEQDHRERTGAASLELELARGIEERLRLEALDSPGGRILLAQEAARNLRLPSVTLNSNDPRVPTPFDLDEIVRRLLGDAP